MSSTKICLGYTCYCGAKVVVYQFMQIDGHWRSEQRASDIVVQCPRCKLECPVRVGEVQRLERWNEEAI